MPKEMDLGLSYESLESSSSDSEVEQCKKDKKLKSKTKAKSKVDSSSNSVANTSPCTSSDSESPEEKRTVEGEEEEEEEKTKVGLTSKLRRVWEEKCQLYSSRMDKLSKVFKAKNGVFSYSNELWDRNWELVGNEK